MLFIQVLLGLLWFLALAALVLLGIYTAIVAGDYTLRGHKIWSQRRRALVGLGCLLGIAALVTVMIHALPSDPAEHCAPGTRYVEETHRSGNHTVTEWLCVAD